MKISKILLFFTSLIIFIIFIEIGLRVLGFTPYKPLNYSIKINPKICYSADSLGIKLMPGEFDININNGLKYKATHNKYGNRITSKNEVLNFEKKIQVYGCSYTYGTGVNDKETYPFLLQKKYPNYQISNLAVPGYGTLQFYLQLKRNIMNNNIPDIVILNCAEFHEERNLLSKSYLYMLYQGYEVFETANMKYKIYPQIIDSKNADLDIVYINIFDKYKPMPCRKLSSIINLVELQTIKEPKELKSSFLLINAISQLCEIHNINLIVTDIANQPERISKFCKEKNINFANISPDFSNKVFSNLPYDNHPSKEAHQVYSEKMILYLDNLLNKSK